MHGVLDRGWDGRNRAFYPAARAAFLISANKTNLSFLPSSHTVPNTTTQATGPHMPEYISVLGAQCTARVGVNGKARYSQSLRPHPPNIFIDDKPIICRELRKTGAIVIQSVPTDPQGLQDDLLAAQQAIDARGRNNLPVARYLQDSELLFESTGRR